MVRSGFEISSLGQSVRSAPSFRFHYGPSSGCEGLLRAASLLADRSDNPHLTALSVPWLPETATPFTSAMNLPKTVGLATQDPTPPHSRLSTICFPPSPVSPWPSDGRQPCFKTFTSLAIGRDWCDAGSDGHLEWSRGLGGLLMQRLIAFACPVSAKLLLLLAVTSRPRLAEEVLCTFILASHEFFHLSSKFILNIL
ncbi:unnamed protein product [Protopolystoma xenopodis]|uniref:Uncharacterized protein n=1 Tax=Protopolystoma xenopodis TaxID=117903 RepID=A0A448WET3_9PLAT|nr:unnamed protein product [Protopolystoma xenopodis]